MDTGELGSRIVSHLQENGQDVVIVKAGRRFERSEAQTYTIDPGDKNTYHDLVKDLLVQNKIPRTILHLWTMIPTQHADEMAQIFAFYSMLFLVQAIGDEKINDPLRIIAVTDSLHEVTGTEVLCPDNATILGPCMVIGREYSNITCRNIDIILDGSKPAQLVEQLISEFASSSSDTIVAYRGINRWVRVFESVHLSEADDDRALLRPGGVYLITGGMGGIGLELAKYLAKRVQPKLVLLGRSNFQEKKTWESWLASHGTDDTVSQKIRKIQDIETLGAEVLVLCADVTEIEQMKAVIEQTRLKFGDIHGVIHAAGLPGGGMIQLKEPEAASRIMAPKVKGTLVLEKLFKGVPLDFMVLCSSLYSVAGGLGQIDYCAGNSFLDAFAHYNTLKNGIPTVSINWDAWLEVGMIVNNGLQDAYKQGMRSQEGLDVFQRILARNTLPQVTVCISDLNTLIKRADVSERFMTETDTSESSVSSNPRPDIQTPYVASGNKLEHLLTDIWKKVLRIENVGIHDNFFDVGGDSVMAIQIVGDAKRRGISIHPNQLFQHPTIAGLAKVIEGDRQ